MNRHLAVQAVLSSLKTWLAVVWLLCAGGVVEAAAISVSPLRVVFTAERGVSAVTLTNTGGNTLTVEAEVVPWPTDAAEQTARDITVNPPISTLAPGEKVIVRVGLVRRLPRTVERAYRLYVTELPTPRSPDAVGVGVRLRLGIPLFVAADKAAPQPLVWSVQREGDTLTATASNPGNVHQRVSALTAVQGAVRHAAEFVSPYVLPGRSTVFRLPGLVAAVGERLSLQVETDDGSRPIDVLVP